MDKNNLKIVQQDIDDAVKAVEDLERAASEGNFSEDIIKEKFVSLNEKVKSLENMLKSEGIL